MMFLIAYLNKLLFSRSRMLWKTLAFEIVTSAAVHAFAKRQEGTELEIRVSASCNQKHTTSRSRVNKKSEVLLGTIFGK